MGATRKLRPGSAAPMTSGQEQVWFAQQLAPGAVFHVAPLVADVTGPLDLKAAGGALRLIVERHAPLRTVFDSIDGRLSGRVLDTQRVPVSVCDLRDAASDNADAALRAWQRRRLGEPFDLSTGPLLRLSVARLADEEHRLLITMHHIVSDGWSLRVLQREFLHCYRELADGRDARLPDLRLSFEQVAAAERAVPQSASYQDDLEYWRGVLADPPDPVKWPFATAHGTGAGYTAGAVPFDIPSPLAGPLRRLATAERSSAFMVLLAAFAATLARCTGSRDLVIGTAAAGRDVPGSEELIGYFVNGFTLRLRLGTDPTPRELLSATRGVVLDGFDHRAAPADRLLRAASPCVSLRPVHQIIFAARPPLAGRRVAAAARFDFAETEAIESLHECEVQVRDTGPQLGGVIRYRSDLFPPEAIRTLADQIVLMVEHFARRPDEHLSNLALAGPDAWRQVITAPAGSVTGSPAGSTLTAQFAAQADATPDATAIVDGRLRLTYRELDERANQLAHLLRRLGVTTGSRAAIQCMSGTVFVVAVLATVKLGAAYVPLDCGYPADRLAYMSHDANAEVIVTDATERPTWAAAGQPVVAVDLTLRCLDHQPRTRPAAVVLPDQLANVIYTSGSTGRPKGVGVTHRNILGLTRGCNHIRFGAEDTVAQVCNRSFDPATLEIWGALLHGARLLVLPREIMLDAPALRAAIDQHGICTLITTTALAMGVIRADPGALTGLRELMFGGEQPATQTIAQLLDAPGKLERVFNAYGPTEATVVASVHNCVGTISGDGPLPIGVPLSGAALYVLDQWLQPVAAGVTGELYIGGAGVTRGYLGDAALTAERFIPDHLGAAPGSRLYRTGDLARRRPDGGLDFVGRADRQVKIRGFRVEPAEIEHALRRCTGVVDAAVAVRRDPAGDQTLVGYVVPGRDLAAVRQELAERVPDALVPPVLVPLPALPLTDSGKVDAAALPVPQQRPVPTVDPPATPTERRVAGLWREVLGVAGLDRDAVFFDHGGHSLKAAQLLARLNRAFGTDLPLRVVFDHPTIGGLSRLVDAAAAARRGEPGAPQLRTVTRSVLSVADLIDGMGRSGVPIAGSQEE